MSNKKDKKPIEPGFLVHPQKGLGIALLSALASSCYQGEIEILKEVTSTDIVGKITDTSGVGLANYRVILLNQYGAPVLKDNEITSIVTGPTGRFGFSNLSEGKYRVLVLPTITPNTVFKPDVAYDPDSVLDGETQVTIPSESKTIVFKYSGIDTTYAPGGTYSPALGAFPSVGYSVSGKVYLNKFSEAPRSFNSGDGDVGIERARVLLFDSAGERIIGANGKPIEAITNSSGDYNFYDLAPGSYSVTVIPEPGHHAVYEEEITGDQIDGYGDFAIIDENIAGGDFGFKTNVAPTTPSGGRDNC